MNPVEFYQSWTGPVRICVNEDAESITSVAVLVYLLSNTPLSLSIGINEQVISSLAKEKYKNIFFVGDGSRFLPLIKKELKGRNVIILDTTEDIVDTSVGHIEGRSVSDAVYSFSSHVADVSSLVHIAALYEESLRKVAIDQKRMAVEESLPIFGRETRLVHKALEFSTELNLPGVTGNEIGSIRFLEAIGIPCKKNGLWRKFRDLSNDECELLVAEIVKQKNVSRENLLVDRYILLNEPPGPTRDLAEFQQLIQACITMGKGAVVIGTCLGDPAQRQLAIEDEKRFRLEIAKALDWYKANRESELVKKTKQYTIVKAQDAISASLIDTLAVILGKKRIAVVLAHTKDSVKVSVSGASHSATRSLLAPHTIQTFKDYAITSIPFDKEEEFIVHAAAQLAQLGLEEAV